MNRLAVALLYLALATFVGIGAMFVAIAVLDVAFGFDFPCQDTPSECHGAP